MLRLPFVCHGIIPGHGDRGKKDLVTPVNEDLPPVQHYEKQSRNDGSMHDGPFSPSRSCSTDFVLRRTATSNTCTRAACHRGLALLASVSSDAQ